jgi:crotonobetaine/carnitine-CoA ligase
VVLVLESGSQLEPAELIRFLIPRMPRYMVPRFVEIVSELPKTEATQRVRKVELRQSPMTPATWDREAAGVEVPR